jgi:hypothetical protein
MPERVLPDAIRFKVLPDALHFVKVTIARVKRIIGAGKEDGRKE